MAKTKDQTVRQLTDEDVGREFILPSDKRPDIGEPLTATLMSIEYNPDRTVATADFKLARDGTTMSLGGTEFVGMT